MEEYLNEIRTKYDYDDDLLKAIEITINLMIEKYGAEQQSEIFSLFLNTEIFTLKEVNRENVKLIEEKKKAFNPNVSLVEPDSPYGDAGYGASLYCFDEQFDDDMKIIDEVRYIIIQDMKGRYNEDGYRKLFGTSINIPYFIHEANHAYAMMHPRFIYDENTIMTKHGMATSTFHYAQQPDGKYIIYQERSNDIILEEMINEMITRNMLVSFFKANNYAEVNDLLNGIHHVPTDYNSLLIVLGEKMEKILGSDALMDYRRNNNDSCFRKFNELARQGEIALEYLGENIPFEYFREKVFELFNLIVNKYKYKLEVYGYESARIMLEAFAPLMSYQEVELKNITIEDYNKIRDNLLGQYTQHQSNNLD